MAIGSKTSRKYTLSFLLAACVAPGLTGIVKASDPEDIPKVTSVSGTAYMQSHPTYMYELRVGVDGVYDIDDTPYNGMEAIGGAYGSEGSAEYDFWVANNSTSFTWSSSGFVAWGQPMDAGGPGGNGAEFLVVAGAASTGSVTAHAESIQIQGPGIKDGTFTVPNLTASASAGGSNSQSGSAVVVSHLNLRAATITGTVSGDFQPGGKATLYLTSGGGYAPKNPKSICPRPPHGFGPSDILGSNSNDSNSGSGTDYASGDNQTIIPGLSSGGSGEDVSTDITLSNLNAGGPDGGAADSVASQYPSVSRSQAADAYIFTAAGDNEIHFLLQDGKYVPTYGGVQDTCGGSSLVDSQGAVASYPDPGVGYSAPIQSYTNATDDTQLNFSYDSNQRLTSVLRTVNVNGHTVVDTYTFSPLSSGTNVGRPDHIILQRTTDGIAQPNPIREVIYSYYDGSDDNGNAGDIRDVTITDGTNVINRAYYRYYTPNNSVVGGQTIGFPHGLKYAVDFASMQRLITAKGDPTSTSLQDSDIAQFATKYLTYDSSQRVASVQVQGAGCSCAGSSGSGLYTYQRHTNPNGTYSDDYNHWKTVTIETLPDGNQNIVYCNYQGQVILKSRRQVSGPVDYPTFNHFTSNGQCDATYEPSVFSAASTASTGVVQSKCWDDTKDDLGLGDATYLQNDRGLVHVYTYGSSLSAPADDPTNEGGQVPGYLQSEGVRQGRSGTLIYTRQLTYFAHTVNGVSVYPIATETDALGNETHYYHTYWNSSNSIQTQTTTKPTVTSNGPGDYGDITVDYYDQAGHVVWSQDPDGYITYRTYDPATGALTQQIADADPTVLSSPSGLPKPTRPSTLPSPLSISTSHTVDPLGRTTMISDPRSKITYVVYDDPNHEVRTYPGWTGSATTGPTQVQREDQAHNYSETLTMTSTPAVSGSIPTGTESISNVQTLTRTLHDLNGRIAAVDRFFYIPNMPSDFYSTAGGINYATNGYDEIGAVNVNYYRTQYGYDQMGRRSRVVDAVGDITRTTYDGMGRVTAVWAGTDDGSGAWNGTNSGTENLVQITQNIYDDPTFSGASGVGDGVLSQVIQYTHDSSNDLHITQMAYDWRDRLIATKRGAATSSGTSGESDGHNRPLAVNVLDDRGSVTAVYQFEGSGTNMSCSDGSGIPAALLSSLVNPGTPAANLVGYIANYYDELGRGYQTRQYSVTIDTSGNGTISSTNSLAARTFYDRRGNVIATYSPGGVVKKSVFDGAGRLLRSYVSDGATDSGWASASSLTGNNVLEETLYNYDPAGNVIETITKPRNHNETTTGELGDSSTSARARVMYTAAYYDAVNRATASVNYGTNGGTAPTIPSTPPTASSSSMLVMLTTYNSPQGWADTVKDPNGVITQSTYDAAGRVTQTIEDYGSGTNFINRKTCYLYDGLDHTTSLKAYAPTATSGYEETQYFYGVTAPSSGIWSNGLLATVEYPDPTAGTASASFSNVFTYDALGEMVQKTDQNGTKHDYTYDTLGRTILDGVTLATSNPQRVDPSVLAIGINFDPAGRPLNLTSYANYSEATHAATTIVNQVQRTYNGFGQLADEYQSHSGAAVSTTPEVHYAYTETSYGSVNNSRLISITYPNGRVVNYLYTDQDSGGSNGESSGVSDTVSRVTAIATDIHRGANDANVIASYEYLGLSTVVRKNYPIPGIRLDRTNGLAGSSMAYGGLDSFNRIISQEWTHYSGGSNTTDVFKINHGYDLDSNRRYADNQSQPGSGHAYGYDHLDRLTSDKAGSLNSAMTDTLPNKPRNDAWTLDTLGNPSAVSTATNPESNPDLNAQNQIQTHLVGAACPDKSGILDDFSSDTSSQWTATAGTSFSIGGGSGMTVNTLGTGGESYLYMKQHQGPPGALGTEVTFPVGATSGRISLVYGQVSISASLDDQAIELYGPPGTVFLSESATIVPGTPIHIGMLILPHCVMFDDRSDGFESISVGIGSAAVGVYTNVAGASLDGIWAFNPAIRKNLWGRWSAGTTSAGCDGPALWPCGFVNGNTTTASAWIAPTFLKGVNLRKFQVDFQMTPSNGVQFVFGGKDDYNWSSIEIDDNGADQIGHDLDNGGIFDYVDGWNNYDNIPSSAGDLWVRVTCNPDASNVVTVCEATSQAGLDSASPCYGSNAFSRTAGQIGFADWDFGEVTNVTVKSYSTTTNSFSVTEAVENFAVDSSLNGTNTLAYDNNGNLTYDGLQAYTYDAWNRLKTVAHAYRIAVADGGDGNVHGGHVFDTLNYDAAGRRVMKVISGTGMDCTYNYYLNGQSVIEEQNGSNQSIKDHVWGRQYVDEAVQTRVNTHPAGTASWTSYWLCQDANYNVLGLVNSAGTLQERYEYSAYGQRQIFVSADSGDAGCYTPAMMSTHVASTGGVVDPYGINEVGHQGLMHDEETGLVYNRARMLNPALGRFMQHDPKRYVDGANLYLCNQGNPIRLRDAMGTQTITCPDGWETVSGGDQPTSGEDSELGEETQNGTTYIYKKHYEWDVITSPFLQAGYDQPLSGSFYFQEDKTKEFTWGGGGITLGGEPVTGTIDLIPQVTISTTKSTGIVANVDQPKEPCCAFRAYALREKEVVQEIYVRHDPGSTFWPSNNIHDVVSGYTGGTGVLVCKHCKK